MAAAASAAMLAVFLPAPAAQALPVKPGTAYGTKISKEAKRQAHITAKITSKLKKGSLTLDYRVVDKYDKHDAKVRRRFAAGWYSG